jgi:hypothetical protein
MLQAGERAPVQRSGKVSIEGGVLNLSIDVGR